MATIKGVPPGIAPCTSYVFILVFGIYCTQHQSVRSQLYAERSRDDLKLVRLLARGTTSSCKAAQSGKV
eukprot:6210544-Amphidinium_carterae.2